MILYTTAASNMQGMMISTLPNIKKADTFIGNDVEYSNSAHREGQVADYP
ncbi:hypothetical protein FACS1894147_03670 [Spirochaetia bacterium]|nr:hypothetical protein FACS1894147_03670 [Spirochaetia bacterium]